MPINESIEKAKIYQLLTALQVKNDCVTLIALNNLIAQPIISLAFLPLYALFVEEMNNTIGEKGRVFDISNDSPFKIGAVRAKLKLFADEKRIGKSKKRMLELDESQDIIFKKKLRFNFTRNLNIHYNLGIYFTNEGKIIGNTQYFYYMFQGNNIDGRKYNNEEIREFSRSLGIVIGSINEGLKNFMPHHAVNIKNREYRIKFKDFNTNKKSFTTISKLQYGKDISLILLHILSNINFIVFILSDALENNNTYLFKIKYISFYYSIRSIEKIIEFFNKNNVDHNTYSSLKECIDDSKFLLDSTFRNCMMHYRYDLDGEYLISDKYLNSNVKLYGLVETFFNGMDYDEIDLLLTEKLVQLSDIIENSLNIDSNKLKDL